MKKKMILMVAMLALAGVFLVACAESGNTQGEAVSIETDSPSDDERPEIILPETETEESDSSGEAASGQAQDSIFTIEQIQAALEPQFQVGDWGEGNPQVISAERVTRDRDSITFESSGSTIDLSSSFRYRVAVRYKQSFEDFTLWSSLYDDYPDIANPFERDGDYTILTEYYYFNDVNGAPVLAFVMD